MSGYIVNGGRKLEGRVRVHGAKNSVLPIMAAAMLSGESCRIYDCPSLSDVKNTINILEKLGCTVEFKDDSLLIDSKNAYNWEIPEDLMREMRSSIIFLGALTGKLGKARMCSPGGCELGNRPIDLHLKALRELGIEIREENGFIEATCENMHCADIHLSFPSVGATENIILTSVRLKGETTISNAAKEPEIVDMCDFLNKMGAHIEGAGTEFIRIKGVAHLHGTEHKIIPDRIVATTLMCAAMTTKSEIELLNVRKAHLGAVVSVLRDSGAKIEFFKDKMYIRAPEKMMPVDMIKTQVYPGFPTDAQSVVMASLCYGEGTSVIVENIFDSRYKIIPELKKMGAKIIQDGRVAVIKGASLNGAHIRA
ncbi:MAG: UDP-N-acetylglucosamine 1-carboxyvinyltransferase, partial [Clostridia bacterium]|nr:UDP-N-acetylglucosamine 1-carboxyvinyltransferase [Clostridia bacterium]